MMERMPGREYLRWVAYFRLKPPGDRLTASMLYNINRKEGATFVEPDDFMNAITQERKRKQREQLSQSPREIRAMLESAAPKDSHKKPPRKLKYHP